MARTTPATGLLAALPGLCLVLACGPVGPFAGGRLGGPVSPVPERFSDLSEIENAQLETNPADPHSINIWITSLDGAAYVSTSLILGPESPEEREWVQNVARDPRIRLRVAGTVYEGRLARLEDTALRPRVLDAFAEKYGEIAPERRSGAWLFRVQGR